VRIVARFRGGRCGEEQSPQLAPHVTKKTPVTAESIDNACKSQDCNDGQAGRRWSGAYAGAGVRCLFVTET
jgi:hypothetical protein